MRELWRLVDRVASSPLPVVVTGETGAGKEQVVRTLHDRSRRPGSLCIVNCGTIPQTLIASTLFGHERGAFTGALRTQIGVFEQAQGGTLCLDEIAELPPEAQAALLRAIETREITRVGGEHKIRVDLRLLACSHRDLGAMVRSGQFRADLLYRLNTVTLRVPPLRERPEEIGDLAHGFLNELGAGRRSVGRRVLDAAALDALLRYEWPGNVRELRNAMQRAAMLCDERVVGVAYLPEAVRTPNACAAQVLRPHDPDRAPVRSNASCYVAEARETEGIPSRRLLASGVASNGIIDHALAGAGPGARLELGTSFAAQIRQREIALLAEALRRAKGCKSRAARLLQMPRRTLMRKVKLYGL